MQAQIHQIITALHAEMNPDFYKGLVKIFHELRISLPMFHDQLDFEYLDYIYNNVSKKRCDLLTYSKLGKYKVDQFIKQKKLNPESTQIDDKKDNSSTFTQFINTVSRASDKYPDNILPFSGKNHFITFTSLFDLSGLKNVGYTPKAVKEALIQAGCIEELPNKHLKFITDVPQSLTSNKDSIRQASDFFNRYAGNMVHNRNLTEGDIKYFEKSILSTEVAPENINACATEFYDFILPQYIKGQKVVDKHETPNVKSTHDVGFHIVFFANERGK